MKVSINFVDSPGRWTRPLLGLAWGSVGVLALTGLWLTHAAYDVRREMPSLHERLSQLDQRQREIVVQERPTAQELQELKRRVLALNALSSIRGHSPVSLLTELEQLLPDAAWLVSLHDRAKAGEILLVAESERVEPLTQFLLRLERQPRFSEVLLVKQAPQGAPSRSIQFVVRLKERL